MKQCWIDFSKLCRRGKQSFWWPPQFKLFPFPFLSFLDAHPFNLGTPIGKMLQTPPKVSKIRRRFLTKMKRKKNKNDVKLLLSIVIHFACMKNMFFIILLNTYFRGHSNNIWHCREMFFNFQSLWNTIERLIKLIYSK